MLAQRFGEVRGKGPRAEASLVSDGSRALPPLTASRAASACAREGSSLGLVRGEVPTSPVYGFCLFHEVLGKILS